MIIITESQVRGMQRLLREMSLDEIDDEVQNVNTFATDNQKKAGNYKKGHIRVRGMKITIENPAGSFRKYKNEDGTNGFVKMKNHYGYFSCTLGKDGDAVDVFIGPNVDDFSSVYVVDQNKEDGSFDESKVMLGFNSESEAKEAYLSNYTSDWKGFRDITGVSFDLFKRWLYRERKQRKPFAEYVNIIKHKIKES